MKRSLLFTAVFAVALGACKKEESNTQSTTVVDTAATVAPAPAPVEAAPVTTDTVIPRPAPKEPSTTAY